MLLLAANDHLVVIALIISSIAIVVPVVAVSTAAIFTRIRMLEQRVLNGLGDKVTDLEKKLDDR